MRDLCHYLELNYEEFITDSKLKIVHPPNTIGSLLLNLLNAKETYQNLIENESVSKIEKIFYSSKKEAIEKILELVSGYLYDHSFDNSIDYGYVIEQFFSYYSKYRIEAKKCLKKNYRFPALKYLSKSYEIYHAFELIDTQYINQLPGGN